MADAAHHDVSRPSAGGAAPQGAPAAVDHKSARAAARAVKLAEAARQLARAESWMGIEGKDQHPSVRYTYASSLFVAAAETFRMYQVWRRAAEALSRASDAEKAKAQMLPCAVLAADSADLYARVDANEAARMYRTASGLFAALGRFITAGNLMVRTGELEESDNAKTSAAESFSLASQYYLAEDAYSLCVGALARAGSMLALEDAFGEAHALFERAARVALDDNLTRWHAPRLALSAGLCLVAAARTCAEGPLAPETAALDQRLEAYQTACAKRDPAFGAGRERRFLLDALDTSRIWAVDDYIDHVWNFDYVARLEPHDLFLCECIFQAVRGGPPKELAKARMAESDMTAVNSVEEEVQVEVEELAPMSAAEMQRTGLTKQLEEEVKKEREEAERDAAAEFLLIHGISREEKEKKEREAAQRE